MNSTHWVKSETSVLLGRNLRELFDTQVSLYAFTLQVKEEAPGDSLRSSLYWLLLETEMQATGIAEACRLMGFGIEGRPWSECLQFISNGRDMDYANTSGTCLRLFIYNAILKMLMHSLVCYDGSLLLARKIPNVEVECLLEKNRIREENLMNDLSCRPGQLEKHPGLN